MVRVGNHSLELVDATTHLPLQEFTKNGETFVCGCAGKEFLVRITSHSQRSRSIANPIKIDGACIGYTFQQGPDKNMQADLAPIEASGGVKRDPSGDAMVRAFRFEGPPPGGAGVAHRGSVNVVWHEGNDTGASLDPWDAVSGWGGGTRAGASAADGKKGVGSLRSTMGSTQSTIAWATSTWAPGCHLATVTVYYAEEAGLVANGIAKRADIWGATGGGGGGCDQRNQDWAGGKAGGKRRRAQAVASGGVACVDLTEEEEGENNKVKYEGSGSSSSSSSSMGRGGGGGDDGAAATIAAVAATIACVDLTEEEEGEDNKKVKYEGSGSSSMGRGGGGGDDGAAAAVAAVAAAISAESGDSSSSGNVGSGDPEVIEIQDD